MLVASGKNGKRRGTWRLETVELANARAAVNSHHDQVHGLMATSERLFV